MATQTGAPAHTVNAPTSRFVQLREVLELLPVGRTTLYVWMGLKVDPFPGAISLGPVRTNGRARVAVWDLHEVHAWLDRQAEKPRTVGTKPMTQPA